MAVIILWFINLFNRVFSQQVLKFVVVGFLNTGIDFGILNLLMFSTDIYKGKWLFLFNVTSFAVAIINSYLWNKFWTFQARQADQAGEMAKEFTQFLVVSLIGLAINSGIVYLMATYIPPFFGLSQGLWTNLAKVAATLFSLTWNFIGYKFIVFRKQ